MKKIVLILLFSLISNYSVANTSQQVYSPDSFVGSWEGTIDNKKVELLFWREGLLNKLSGFVYMFEYDCLLYASVHFNDMKKPELIFYRDKFSFKWRNNCAQNTGGLSGPHKFKFSGSGNVYVKGGSEILSFVPNSLYSGKEIVNPKSENNISKKNKSTFRKTLLSPELFYILDDCSKARGGPCGMDGITWYQMKKNRRKPSQELSKPGSFKALSPYHNERFLTRWNSELYDLKNDKDIQSTVVASRRSDGKLVLKIQTENSDYCIGDLVEEELFSSGYIVKLSAAPDSTCNNNVITHGYIHPFSSRSTKWPQLKLFNTRGELVATGSMGGVKGGLEGLFDPYQVYGIDKKIEGIIRSSKIAALKAIKPQTLYTQCRIHELEGGYENDPKWCLCIDENYRDQLSAGEHRRAVEDYRTFLLSERKDPSLTGNWRHNNIENYCRDCYQKNYQGCLQIDDKSPNKRNYSRIFNAFLNGTYHTIEKDVLYKNFVVDYLQAYSDWCGRNYMQKPVHRIREIREINMYTGDQVGPTQRFEIYIDSQYVTVFDRYVKDINFDAWVRFNPIIGLLDLPATIKKIVKYTLGVVEARFFFNDHMNNQCSSEDVQTVYEGILKYQ